MANTLKIKRGSNATVPQGQLAEPLFTTDTYDLYIGKGSGGNQRFQKYIASGTSSQFLKGDGSLDSTTYQATSEKGQNNGYASLDSGGKVPVAQLPNSIMEYLGTWDASTNTPTLANGTGNAGDVYICSIAGTVNFGAGAITFAAGDWVVYSGSIWQKSINSNAVASVNGQTGAVVLYTDDISEDGSPVNLWFTNARARTAISLTTSGTSGAATYDNSTGVLNVPNYGGALSGYLPLTGGTLTGALNGTSSSMSSTSTATAFIPTGSTVPTNGMYLPSANTLGLSANSTKVIEISDSGRVSIGATSPTTDALTVHGAITTTNGGNITSSGMISSNSTISSGLNIIAASSITGSALVPSGTTAPTVGMYLVSGTSILNGVLGFSTGSTKRLEINNSTGDATFTNNISAANLSGTNTGDQTLSGLGGVPTTRTITINGTSFDLSANRTYSVGTIGGSGTSGYVSKFTGSTTIGNSLIYDSGVRAISIGNSSTNSWASPFYVIEGGTYGQFIGFQTNNPAFKLGTNSYFNGSNYIYTNTGYGVSILDIGSDATNAYLDFYGAPTGTAGNAATISKKFSIDNTGNAYFVESLGVGFTSGTINGRIDFRNAGNAIIVGKNTTGGTNTYSSIRLTTANSGGVGDSIGEIRGLSTNVNNRDIALTFLTSEGSAGQTEKMRITAGGNVGIGTTPSAWYTYSKVLQLGGGASIEGRSNIYDYSSINTNSYADVSGTSLYMNNGYASRYYQYLGSHNWLTAPSGTAGNAITFTQAMTLDASGRLGIGTTSPLGPIHAVNTSSYSAPATTGNSIGHAIFGKLTDSGIAIGSFRGSGTSGYTWFQAQILDAAQYNNNIVFQPNGGLVGIGTPSPSGQLHLKGASGLTNFGDQMLQVESSTSNYSGIVFSGTSGSNAAIRSEGASTMTFWTASGTTYTERMRITSGGNVLIGTTTDQGRVTVANSACIVVVQSTTSTQFNGLEMKNGGGSFYFGQDNSTGTFYGSNAAYAGSLYMSGNYPMVFFTNQTERMRITSGGYLKASSNSTYVDVVGSYHELRGNGSNGYELIVSNVNTTPASQYVISSRFSSSTPNNTSARFLDCEDATATRAYIRSNGGFSNYQANDTNLSDIRTKKDIVSLESYWDKFKALEIVKFKYNDQTHDDYNIGLIAQQVENVAPEFVDVDGWGETPEDGVPYKSVYTADLHHATIKVLQEAMAKIEEQQAQIEELKSKLN